MNPAPQPPEYRPIPRDLSRRRLFLPDPDYPFLLNAEDHPFRPDTGRFETLNAWWLAEIAMMAYLKDPDLIRELLQHKGFLQIEFIESPSTSRFNTRCLWAVHEHFAIVCFRGSEPGNPKDYVTDLRFLPVPLEGDQRIHGGFYDAFGSDGIEDRLGEHIATAQAAGCPIYLTGHSLGGALATLAARRFETAAALYTLGAPRVGNVPFWKSIRPPVYRIVNFSDLVTMLPAATPGFYAHGGYLKYLDAEGRLRSSMLTPAVVADRLKWPGGRYADVLGRWWKGEVDQIPLRSISDHSPLHYALHLWNNYVATGETA